MCLCHPSGCCPCLDARHLTSQDSGMLESSALFASLKRPTLLVAVNLWMQGGISTWLKPYTDQVSRLFSDSAFTSPGVHGRMAYATTAKRNHSRGPAIVLGVLAIVAFMVFLLAAAPGKATLQALGMSNDIDPMTGLGSMYSSDNVRCAFGQMSCDIFQ